MSRCHACGAEYLPNCLRCSMCGTPRRKNTAAPFCEGETVPVSHLMGETQVLSQDLTGQDPVIPHNMAGRDPVYPQDLIGETQMLSQDMLGQDPEVPHNTGNHDPVFSQDLMGETQLLSPDIWQQIDDGGATAILFQSQLPGLTVQEILRRHSGPIPLTEQDIRIGSTPRGGAYSICYRGPIFSQIVEYDESGRELASSIGSYYG